MSQEGPAPFEDKRGQQSDGYGRIASEAVGDEGNVPYTFDPVVLSGHPFALGSVGDNGPVIIVVLYILEGCM